MKDGRDVKELEAKAVSRHPRVKCKKKIYGYVDRLAERDSPINHTVIDIGLVLTRVGDGHESVEAWE